MVDTPTVSEQKPGHVDGKSWAISLSEIDDNPYVLGGYLISGAALRNSYSESSSGYSIS
jgi:hypothetical protein